MASTETATFGGSKLGCPKELQLKGPNGKNKRSKGRFALNNWKISLRRVKVEHKFAGIRGMSGHLSGEFL